MGVSLVMKVCDSKGNFVDPRDITPDLRSRAAEILERRFGGWPCRLYNHDVSSTARLIDMAEGASLYRHENEENFWQIILTAVEEYGGVEIEVEY